MYNYKILTQQTDVVTVFDSADIDNFLGFKSKKSADDEGENKMRLLKLDTNLCWVKVYHTEELNEINLNNLFGGNVRVKR